VLLIGHYASFGGAGELAEEFRRRSDWTCTLVVDRRDEGQEFWREYGAVYWPDLGRMGRWRLRRELRCADLTVVAGTCSLDLWSRIALGEDDPRTGFDKQALTEAVPALGDFCTSHRTTVLVTDSHLLRDPGFWRDVYRRLAGLQVLAMPDLMPVIGLPDVGPYWPPVACLEPGARRPHSALRVGHSPSKAERRAQKGSDLIETTCQELGIDLEIVSGLSHRAALERKQTFDLFIDQVSDFLFEGTSWHGGMGKSGLEAMAMGCAVLTSGTIANTEPDLPMPPVVWTDRERFEKDLRALHGDPERLRKLGHASREWVRQAASPGTVVDYLLTAAGVAR
jgi:hypothetical protein